MNNQDFVVELYNTFLERWDVIKLAFQEHVILVTIAMLVATIIAVPLGILLTNFRKYAEPVIGVTAIAQTIPSLAFLGFMLPLVGIGKLNAIIALTVYALLPILRNTYTGILEVDSAIIEAGKGMGMTKLQQLFMIELPLAFPVIMAGIRTATVISIGVATLATFVGAGGLGDLIYRGIAMQNNALILTGAIPAALLAVVTDFILRRVEISVIPKGVKK